LATVEFPKRPEDVETESLLGHQDEVDKEKKAETENGRFRDLTDNRL
jgi:hypothetical protein